MLRFDGRVVRLVLGLGMVVGVGATATHATWLDTTSVSGTTIRTGDINLKVNNTARNMTWPDLNYSSLAPGRSTAGTFELKNGGNMAMAYYLDSSASNADGKGLGAALVVKVTGAAATTGSPPSETCSGTALSGSGTSFTTGLIGSAASRRLLAAGASETLCVEATLPSNAPATVQGASTNVAFNFYATTSPASPWTDTMAVTGTTLASTTVGGAPTISCTLVDSTTVTIGWPAVSGATGYRLFYGTDGSTVEDVSASTLSKSFTNPASGTMTVQAMFFGSSTWVSAKSNSRTYSIDGISSSCS